MVTTAGASGDVLVTVRHLLDRAFDDFDDDDDWDHALGGCHAVVTDGADATIVAHGSVVPRDLHVAGRALRAGYLEAVATAPNRQAEGVGSMVVAALGVVIRERYEFGALSTDAHRFYERLGWERWRGRRSRDAGTLWCAPRRRTTGSWSCAPDREPGSTSARRSPARRAGDDW
jgi:aminoglycoside 2'-N-acetyltransferase I